MQLHRHIQVSDHLLHQAQLLVVLLAKNGVSAVGDVEKLVNHCQRTGKVPRASSTFELRSQRPRLHRRAETVGVHLLRVRRKDQLSTDSAELLHVFIQSPRVGIKVLPLTELQRIDENRHHHNSARQCLRGLY